jgi:dTDP-4-dehydrorhamnose 3,5-epimerase
VGLSDSADVTYKVTGYWTLAVDGGILWNDPAIGIKWPLPPGEAIVTAKDAALPTLAAADHDFVWKP